MKIAYLFLIYNRIVHEDLWKLFFDSAPTDQYSIYIHYKQDVPLTHFEAYKLKDCVETKYADISLIHAQNKLLEHALKDEAHTHFVFVSQSCIPVKPFSYISQFLQPEYSYFNMTPQSQCFPRCNPTLKHIERRFIQKAHQWCILNRKHALLMVEHTEYIQWFAYKGTVPDEHSYISHLYSHSLENELITTLNIASGATTFTHWRGMGYKYESNAHGLNYHWISKEELLYILESKSLFARKFNPECISCLKIPEYLDYIQNGTLLSSTT